MRLRALPARLAFARAGTAPAFLDPARLDALVAEHAGLASRYTWDPEARTRRAAGRVRSLLALPLEAPVERAIEVACHDGLVAAGLARRGVRATAIDAKPDGFDPRARDAGVDCRVMDAEALEFDDESFDLAVSYNAFEHFADPAAMLAETMRVVRRGGYVLLQFNPLYRSAFGQHARGTVPLPYCQFLFEREALDDFARRHGREPIDFSHVNGWSLARYRALWERFADRLERVRYVEVPNLRHVDLIRRHPSCFRSECNDFEEFLVAGIDVLFRRIA